jgi:small subunit ribosomal protein S17
VKQQKKANRKIRNGVVVSNKMAKTVVVQVERKVRHPFYHKVINISNKFKAHDEGNVCAIGDLVRIMETRPISKDKRWVVMEIIKKGKEKLADEDKGKPAPIRRVKEENDTN